MLCFHRIPKMAVQIKAIKQPRSKRFSEFLVFFFRIKNIISIGSSGSQIKQTKAMRAYAESGQYHINIESGVHLIISTSL